MQVYKAKLFMNGRSQAIRLPKECRFDNVSEVSVSRQGESLYIQPIFDSWDSILKALDQFPDDFELTRAPVDLISKDLFL